MGLLALHLGHDLDLCLGHGRPLLGYSEAVLEGGDLGCQVALGQECVGLGFQCSVTLAAQALDFIDHGLSLGMELDDLPAELPGIGEVSDARGVELVVLEFEARGIEFELLLDEGNLLIAVGLNLFIPIRRLGELAAEFIHLGHEHCVLGSEVGSLAQQLLPPCRLDPLGSLIEDGFTPDVSLIFFSLGLSAMVRHSNQQWAWLRHAVRLGTMHGRC